MRLTSDEYLTGSVKASYTFGQPVKGMVELHVSSTEETYTSCRSQPLFLQMAFDIDGEAKFSVPNVDIRRFMSITEGSQVTVKAIVKEARTDVHLEGSTNVTYRDSPYKVKILDNTPSVFKPGLPFSVFVKVSMQDDSPVLGENSVTVLGIGTYSIPVSNSYLYGTNQFTGSYPLGVRTIDVPPSGVVTVDVDIPFNVSEIKVIVYFKDLSAVQTASKLYSPSNNYLQLTVLDQYLKSGQTVHVRAQATENIGDLRYEILSRGVVCGSGVVNANNQTEVTFGIPLTFKMAPTTHMTSYYMHAEREVVADSIAFNVDGIFENEVSLEMSVNRTEPHTDLEVYVTADPNSVVHLLAVDQSVLLIKTGNDVTPSQVKDGVAKQDVGSKPSDSAFALSLSTTNTRATLQAVGLDVYSNMDLYTSQQPTIQEPYDSTIYGPPILAVKPTDGPIPYPPSYTGETPSMYPPMYTGENNLKEVTRVRSLFPETWLWLNQSVGVNGTAVIRTTVPDTITSWVTTAFATNLDSGFGIVPQASKLTVFRSFFVSLNMPTSVVRGEYVVIQAGIFNYLPTNTTVLVTLPASHEYMNVVIDSDGSEILTSEDQKQVVQISSNEQAVVHFPIIPSDLGTIDIEVSARSTMAADAERRQLHVQAEGVPNEFSVPVFIHLDPTSTNSFTKSFNITLPSDIVEGSSRASIRVTGDILGPSIEGLESLLRMPTGCGEQNMILMAPHVYVYTLLTSTRQITPELDARLKYFIERGYQRELTYQRQDGSFSSFGDRDSAGSTWLTAFVLRVFHQARGIIFVDKHVLQRAVYWLLSHQNTDGSFNEFGHVYDVQMRSFGDHSPGLTAFVLLALTENTDADWMTGPYDIRGAINKAKDFLIGSFDRIYDELSLVLTSYVLLGMPNSSELEEKILTVLKTRVFRNNEIVLGRVNQTNQVNSYSRWGTGYTRARPIDIQLTSYALLSFTARGLFQEGLELLSWLTHQRNPYGGFVSTQDTIVALQAMTEFVKHYAPSGYDMHVLVRTEQSPFHFEVNMNNSQVLQSHGLSYIPKELTFEATGHGLVVAELDVFFNAESDFGESAFDVSTVLLDDYLNSFKLMICTRYRLAGESGMVVQEVGIPSGFAPDVTSIGNVAGLKRVEQRGRFLDVYIDRVERNSMCYTVMFDRRDKVAHSQTSYVITQEYYEPGNRDVVGYQPVSLRDATVCDVCQDCC
ncbi:CD109 antigen-like [Pomacea canaliculata]|uniref:CD109 antigen-like n=1 Tax=Pomacea canaliculata TaxID=400727 RepID=UPI000D72BE46|nr:CD109 antigen-like [Pomacea canaliculata]